jgi:hypothetical protein
VYYGKSGLKLRGKHYFTRKLQLNSSTGHCPQLKVGPTKPGNTQSGLIEIREVDIVSLLHLRLAMSNSIKEAIKHHETKTDI